MTKEKSHSILELQTLFREIERIAPHTVVHRKKFEFAINEVKNFFSSFNDPTSPSFQTTVNSTFNILNKLKQLMIDSTIQNWADVTIRSKSNDIFSQMTEILQEYILQSTRVAKKGSFDLSKMNETLRELHAFDLAGIQASFTNFLKNPVPEPVKSEINKRLLSIQQFLSATETSREYSPIPVDYRTFTVNYEDFEELKEIGHGISACVFKGINKKTNEFVAIKKFKLERLNSTRFQVYQREVAALAKAAHPTLIRLLGVTETEPFCIITEWMDGGSLFHALREKSLTATERSIAAFDIARGMQFLHSIHIVHRDLKSLNVLLNNKKAKICDFGFARFADENTKMASGVGTPFWMSPELLNRSQCYTNSVDVYAYGIVLWELVCEDVPYHNIDQFELKSLVVSQGLRPPLPDNVSADLRALISQCWDQLPERRPSFPEIVARFLSGNIYISDTDLTVFRTYIEDSITEQDKRNEELIKHLFYRENVHFPKFLEADFTDEQFERIAKVLEEDDIIFFLDLFPLFIKTKFFKKATKVLRKQPSNVISQETLTKFILELPTGRTKIDTNITVAACKNSLADLCLLYSNELTDIVLCLETLSVIPPSKQLHAAVVDKSVYYLASKRRTLSLAALKCLSSLNEFKRISNAYKLGALQKDSIRDAMSLVLAQQSLSGLEIPEEILTSLISVDSAASRYAIATVCDIYSSAKFVLENISKINSSSTEFLSILLKIAQHKSLHPQLREHADLIPETSIGSELKKILELA